MQSAKSKASWGCCCSIFVSLCIYLRVCVWRLSGEKGGIGPVVPTLSSLLLLSAFPREEEEEQVPLLLSLLLSVLLASLPLLSPFHQLFRKRSVDVNVFGWIALFFFFFSFSDCLPVVHILLAFFFLFWYITVYVYIYLIHLYRSEISIVQKIIRTNESCCLFFLHLILSFVIPYIY